MQILIDTHAVLWFCLNDSQLSRTAQEVMTDNRNELFVSPASFWELAIKISQRKYSLPKPLDEFINTMLDEQDFNIVPISVAHVATVASLPFHHKDPFDRMLVSQSLVEKWAIVSNDAILDAYGVNRIW